MLIVFSQQKPFAQMTLSARIQGKETEKKSLDEGPVSIDINKNDYKGVCNFDLVVEEKNNSSAYRNTIEIEDSNGSKLYSADESENNPGVFKINPADKCKLITSQKMLKIVLFQNPANDKMMMPSRRKQLAEVHLK